MIVISVAEFPVPVCSSPKFICSLDDGVPRLLITENDAFYKSRIATGDYLRLFSVQGDYGDFFNENWLKKQLFLRKGDYWATFFASHGVLI